MQMIFEDWLLIVVGCFMLSGAVITVTWVLLQVLYDIYDFLREQSGRVRDRIASWRNPGM